MKKSNFVTLVLCTIGGFLFALGMCMALLPEWNMGSQGIVCGGIGLAVLLAALVIRRKMTGKPPVRLKGKTVCTIILSALGLLALGGGMCLVMVFSQIFGGIALGMVGIVLLLFLIPLTKGLRN